MKETINLYQFREGFRQVRPDNFSYEGLKILFDHLEQWEADIGEELEFDVIAFCGEFAEDNWKSIAENYGFAIDPKCSEEENMEKICDYLSDQGHYIGQTQQNIVYRQF